MKLDKSLIIGNLVVFIVCGIPASFLGGTGIGAEAVIIGISNVIAGLICLVIGQINKSVTLLICGGVLLLFGFSLCSAFPLNFSNPAPE